MGGSALLVSSLVFSISNRPLWPVLRACFLSDNTDTALHTQLWVDPAEEFLQYTHSGEPVDVTFCVKELKVLIFPFVVIFQFSIIFRCIFLVEWRSTYFQKSFSPSIIYCIG